MVCSARASSSIVDTPGLAAARTACRVRPTISPAACMASSSPGVRAGIRFLRLRRPILLADGFHRGVIDLVDGAFGLDVDDLIAVVVDQWHGLVAVDGHAGADGFLVVIGAATSQHALDD